MAKNNTISNWTIFWIIFLILGVLSFFEGTLHSFESMLFCAFISGVVTFIIKLFRDNKRKMEVAREAVDNQNPQSQPEYPIHARNAPAPVERSIAMFFYRLQDDQDFMEYLHHNVEGLETIDKMSKEEIITGYDNRLFIIFFSDFANAFQKMGHVFTYQHDKTRILINAIIILYKTANRNDLLTSEQEKKLKQLSRELLKNVSGVKCTSNDGDYEFAITEILKAAEMPSTARDYEKLIYKFCCDIADTDFTPTETEKNYISGFRDYLNGADRSKTVEQKASESKGLQDLNHLTGLQSVKEEISSLVNFIKIQQMRLEKGMKVTPVSYHCVFTGNPGTGKTTVARIIADIYRELGIIKKGHLIETDRAGLVAEYVGPTAVKTNQVIDKALDGILFIDEAYSLVPEGASGNDYGQEAIATLLKRMEDNRDRLIVILAGYGNEMRRFIESNPGLESRFNRYLNFDDYNPAQLAEIFKAMAADNDYILDSGALDKLSEITSRLVANKDRHFGNARTMRNLFEKAIAAQATRLAVADPSSLFPDDLRTISATDL